MIELFSIQDYGWEAAIRGMRNPMNSWNRMDSEWDDGRFVVGKNDLKLMHSLAAAGTSHSKFLRMIGVSLDINAPLYWWKEFDTYKVGTVANSCSTMHKIHSKPFERADFSHDHLIGGSINLLDSTIDILNYWRDKFNVSEGKDKEAWWQMIQLLPSSYNQRRTVTLNYAVLRNQYRDRISHKQDEWREYCQTLAVVLPHSELFTEVEPK